MKRMIVWGTVVALSWACSEGSDVTGLDDTAIAVHNAGHDDDVRTYEVTIQNLTDGQPLSPGVVVTHNGRNRLFKVGRRASEGIRLIAENGDPSQAAADLPGVPGVDQVLATGMPVGCVGCPGPFADVMTVTIEASGDTHRLSLALMLICTNDGFVGVNGVRLPTDEDKPVTRYARGYDSGTERNDELWSSIVDPCGGIGPVAGPMDGSNDRTPTDRRIRHHRGIRGVGDLTDAHAWRGRVAKITIRLLDDD